MSKKKKNQIVCEKECAAGLPVFGYDYDDVYKSTLEYFDGDDLATNVWITKYCKKEKDELADKELPEQCQYRYFELNPSWMFMRIAGEINRAGKKYRNNVETEKVIAAIDGFDGILFQGRPMAGIGINDAVSISNCFVVGKPGQDSYGTIALIDQQIMQLSKRGGGVGTDLSDYRSAGARVHNAAVTSSGPIDICANRFSNTIREVGQNGRRGALMLSMDINSPSAEAFVDAKTKEGKIAGANISVKLNDKWLESATGETRDGKKLETVDPECNRLWHKIIHNATTMAEPGILFWDTITRESVADCYADLGFNTVSTNPCVTGDTLVTTDKGDIKMKELVERFNAGEKFNVLSYDTNTDKVESKNIENALLTRENANVIELELEDGTSIKLTPDHKVYTENRGYVKACELTGNDILLQIEIVKKIKIRKINVIPNEDVYDITVKDNHNFFANGILVHNCGEIPLAPYDACRLMALNLYSFVVNPWTEYAYFDYKNFIEKAKLCMVLMDNMIDLEIEKIDRILAKVDSDPEDEETKKIEKDLWTKVRNMNLYGRRSGIGITGEGDMLAALGYRYGTPEATKFAVAVQRLLALSVYVSSCDLVQKDHRKPFKVFDYKREKDNPFLNRLCEIKKVEHDDNEFVKLLTIAGNELAAEFASKWKKGRRNIACLTIAPTGSLSCLTQTTSGIEPVFQLAYRRRRKIDKTSGVKPDFIDKAGDWFIQFNVVHHGFVRWYAEKWNMEFAEAKKYLEKIPHEELDAIIEMSPYYKATAMDCDWEERIHMQGEIQKYVDHSISMTCNLPKGTPESVVENVYKTAWQSGCKGCTIYVDGCRDGVLLTTESEKKKKCECDNMLSKKSAPVRPKKLPCKILRFNNRGEKWIAAVGLYEGTPYELFTGLAEKLNVPQDASNVYIVRNKETKEEADEYTMETKTVTVSRYDIEYKDKNGEVHVIEGLSRIFNKEFWNYGKFISGLLRYRTPISHIIKVIGSLNFAEEGISTWKAGVIRALKPFLEDGEVEGEKCPKCGGTLVRNSGCVSCRDCGWSKCG